MQKIVLDEEFKALLLAPDTDTYEKQGPTPSTFTGPKKPIDAMTAAVYSLDLSVKALADTLSLLDKVRSADERKNLKKALRLCIDHLVRLYRQIP